MSTVQNSGSTHLTKINLPGVGSRESAAMSQLEPANPDDPSQFNARMSWMFDQEPTDCWRRYVEGLGGRCTTEWEGMAAGDPDSTDRFGLHIQELDADSEWGDAAGWQDDCWLSKPLITIN